MKIETVEALRELIGEPFPGSETKVVDHIDEFAREFIARSPFAVLSTASAEGRMDASPKGDAPGFVLVEDEHTVVIPDRPGNKLAFGHQNILENPQVGLLLMVPNTAETLRINGTAELSADPALLESMASRGKPAVLAIRITVEECFFHCGKAFIRSKLWQPDEWGERYKISFGKMIAKKAGADDAFAKGVDDMIAKDYEENL